MMRMNQTNHFKHERGDTIECPCCYKGTLTPALLIVLEHLRAHYNAPVTITSGARCKKRNAEVGGSPRSEHLIDEEGMANAADIQVKGVRPNMVAKHLRELPYANLLGIGVYPSWVHVDVRGYPARW